MKVLKFGGTSVGSVKSIESLRHIVEKEAKKQPVIVVVSALGGITDKLIATSKMAETGDEAWRISYEEIVDRHYKMIDTIITDNATREKLFATVDTLLEQLKSILFGVFLVHDLSKKSYDAIVSYGERLSSHIVAALIRGSKRLNSLDFIMTERKDNRQVLDSELTNTPTAHYGGSRLHQSRPPHPRDNQLGARRFRLHRIHHRSGPGCRGVRDMDRCRRIYDRRPTRHQDRVHHQRTELHRGDGTL